MIGARAFAAVVGACVVAFVLAALVAPLVPVDPSRSAVAAFAAFGLGFAAVSAMTIAAGAVIGPLPPRALALWVPVIAVLAGSAATRASGIAASALVIVALLTGGAVSGGVVGARIQHAGHVVIVAVVSSLADVWSVLSPAGPSAAALESAPMLSVLALPFPMLGTRAIEPLLGIGDVVFVALYLTVSRRFALGVRRTIVALGIAFAVTAASVIALERALPALPFLGAAILVAHPETRLPPPHERRVAAIGIGVLAVLVISVLALSR
ncbi:hypothetical protein [Sandaracinus amylolyticus]|uniref:Uncharacterized protein n=1 Tax=Sandaracinus amylolyticus TaxID=927083 RepID=A0A0F6SGB3_9BACT|nr:hypothetical protein [Sandaracinus amylolyticus]AKF08394.1 hypothetical protein DB32_005543 [Sandaracinus amylolyticus]